MTMNVFWPCRRYVAFLPQLCFAFTKKDSLNLCVISGFRSGVNEICALLRFYAV